MITFISPLSKSPELQDMDLRQDQDFPHGLKLRFGLISHPVIADKIKPLVVRTGFCCFPPPALHEHIHGLGSSPMAVLRCSSPALLLPGVPSGVTRVTSTAKWWETQGDTEIPPWALSPAPAGAAQSVPTAARALSLPYFHPLPLIFKPPDCSVQQKLFCPTYSPFFFPCLISPVLSRGFVCFPHVFVAFSVCPHCF